MWEDMESDLIVVSRDSLGRRCEQWCGCRSSSSSLQELTSPG